jgi:GTP diphosphokinase / guanosine-3',5'-bis(diphosphate) 3'-diphosphatase
MSSVNDIIAKIGHLSKKDEVFITKAYEFAEKAHQGHTRISGEPYFTHLYETAVALAELGMGPKSVAAGLLHDSIEDVGVTEENLEKEFGSEIVCLVKGVTKLGKLKYRGVKRHAESLRKLLVATSDDVRVLIIKLADRLHNMKTLSYIPEQKQKRLALETLEIYAPVADRLGIGRLKGELEDLAFPYIYPEDYEKVSKLRKQKSKENLRRIEKISKSLKKALAQNNITNIKTDFRIKRHYSLYRKLKKKDWDIDEIHDISALRIVLPKISDCYRVLGIIHSIWRPLPGKIKDYIAFPKPNGYQSLHTTIFTGDGGFAEIQIRTEKMHREAEYGIAAHVSYKNDIVTGEKKTNLPWIRRLFPSLLVRRKHARAVNKKMAAQKYTVPSAPEWIKQIASAHKDVRGSEKFMKDLKTDFFSFRVFVFTPKGDVIDLPIDSSPIDFAYAIHSDIGDHVAGAKVNGKLVSLDTKLQNGDIVEINTKKASRPTRKWLDFAKTSFAQRHIKNVLQKENA